LGGGTANTINWINAAVIQSFAVACDSSLVIPLVEGVQCSAQLPICVNCEIGDPTRAARLGFREMQAAYFLQQ